MTLQRMPITRAARSPFISSLSFRRAAARRHLASTSIANIPQDERIEEELLPDYAADDFYSVTIGDVYNGKYKMVAKLGFGRASTVWLARVEHWWNFLSNPRFVAIKVGRSNEDARRAADNELRISERLKADKRHPWSRRVRQLVDSFELSGKTAGQKHLCLVHDVMREPVSLLQQRFKGDKFPAPYVKFLVRFMLEALEYLHEICGVVHTDMKLDNILLTFEDRSVLQKTLNSMDVLAMPHKVAADGHLIYQSLADFGFPQSFRMVPKLGDFGLAYPKERPEALRRVPIQPLVYQAPEVILGTSWSCQADIWNLGCLIWNWIENRDLFPRERVCSPEGRYEARRHLAEMYTFFGPTPPSLIERSLRESQIKWPQPADNVDGTMAQTPAEYHGGPFFSEEGKFLHMDLVSFDRPLASTVTTLEGKEKELFLDFVFQMLRWLPESRKPASELLRHPWLEF